jgi:hypothetical protein
MFALCVSCVCLCVRYLPFHLPGYLVREEAGENELDILNTS